MLSIKLEDKPNTVKAKDLPMMEVVKAVGNLKDYYMRVVNVSPHGNEVAMVRVSTNVDKPGSVWLCQRDTEFVLAKSTTIGATF